MSRLKSASTAIIPKPFVDLPGQKLYIAASANTKNQIVKLHAKYKGKEFFINVVNDDIEGAWKQLEKFISKLHNSK